MIEPATPITRWQQFYGEDPGIAAIQPSQCVQWAVEQFRQRGARRVLDLGCGAGRDTAVLAQYLPAVIGVDAAEAGLVLASQQAILQQRHTPLLQADARCLPFRPASFDGVYCFGLLHEFVGVRAVEDVQHVMNSVHAVLKPGGVLILAVLAGEPEQGLPHVRMFTEAMLLAATRAFSCAELTALEDVGCTGSAHYSIHRGVFLREQR
jgi:SAM-dependent methyltransferase